VFVVAASTTMRPLHPEEESMNRRFVVFLSLAFALTALASPSAAQSRAKGNSPAPRGPDGKPNLQGTWDFRSLTPLERPSGLGDKQFLTEEEAREIERQNQERRARAATPSDPTAPPRAPGGGGRAVGGYNDFWLDGGVRVVGDRRTSLIVDPPDGRLPALKPGIPHQTGSLVEDLPLQRPVRVLSAGTVAAGPEDRGLAERCLVGFNSGPPMLPSGYNNHMQLFQTADYVAILNEMNHDTRMIPLDDRPHVSKGIPQWAGSSRGRWEGDTLVVTTTNFTDRRASFNPNVVVALGTGSTLTLTERFRRIDEETLHYEFTIDDATTFTRPFTAIVEMRRSDEPVLEYACHEGNYGLRNILVGARAAEAGSR
jgi:hypothetical protein